MENTTTGDRDLRLVTGITTFLALLLAMAVPVSIAAATGIAIILIPFWLWNEFHKPGNAGFQKTGWEWPVIIYIGCAAISALGGIYPLERLLAMKISSPVTLFCPHRTLGPMESLLKLRKEWILLFAFITAHSLTKDSAQKCLKIFALASCVMALLGLAQYTFSINRFPDSGHIVMPEAFTSWPQPLIEPLALRNGRAVATRSHPLTFAECQLLALPVCSALLQTSALLTKIGWATAVGLIMAAIGVSMSRGVWLSILVVAFAYTAIRFHSKKKVAIPVLFAVLFLGFIFTVPNLRLRMVETVTNFSTHPSNAIRLGLWKESIKVFLEHPIIGVGSGNLRMAPKLPETIQATVPKSEWTEAHNIFLQALAERGILGFTALLILLMALGNTFLASPYPWNLWLSLGFLALMLAGLTESWMNDSEVAMSVYFLAGAAHSLRKC